MSKYKIIITLILFCFFQTTPSISLELKLPKKLGDLKKITEDIKKELEKKEPEVKKEEVKKEEVKKEEVKKEEVSVIKEESFLNKSFEVVNTKPRDCTSGRGIYKYLYNFFADGTASIIEYCGEEVTPNNVYQTKSWKLLTDSPLDKQWTAAVETIYDWNNKTYVSVIGFNFENSKISIFNDGNLSVEFNLKSAEDLDKKSAEEKIAKGYEEECKEKNSADYSRICPETTDLYETLAFLVNGDLDNKSDPMFRKWKMKSCVLDITPSLGGLRNNTYDFNKVVMKSTKVYEKDGYSWLEADCGGNCNTDWNGTYKKMFFRSSVAPARLGKAFSHFSSNFCKGFKSKF